MYKFEDIELRCISGQYQITAAGIPIDEPDYTDAQLANPLLAVRRFSDAIKIRLSDRAKVYLAQEGKNTVTGCEIDMPCLDCIAYRLNEQAAGCIKED
ncbi:MAG: hypothetical protein IJM87_08300 [Ruminococcus sp.]|nr:hypothetical protein [Ruminococcus sp.]